MILLAMVGLLAAQAPAVSVQNDRVDGRVALRIAFEGPVDVQRREDAIVVALAGEFPDLPALPKAVPPMTSLTAEEVSGGGLRVVVGADAALPYEIERRPTLVLVILGSPPPPPAAPPADADTAALYTSILPAPLVEAAQAAEGVGVIEEPTVVSEKKTFSEAGIFLGRVTFRPWISAGYVDSDVVVVADEPAQHQRYAEVQPRLTALMPVGQGSLRGSYEVRLRSGAALDALNKTSHVFNATLELPLGPRLEVDASEHYIRGVAEIGEVDPGREYFTGLTLFTRNDAAAGVRIELGPRMALEAGGRAGRVRMGENSGFFDYDTLGVHSRLSRELNANLRVGARLGYSELEAPQRSIANMHATSAQAQLWGDINPLTTGTISLGFTSQENPEAPEEGKSFRGWIGRMEIQRDLTRTASVRLAGSRGTHASAFARNGYYLTTTGEAELALPLPFNTTLRGGTGYHVNQYFVTDPILGVPREDRIFTWSVGLARRLGRWGFWRADYLKESRDSNIDALDHDLQTIIFRLGVGLLETAPRQ